MEVSSGQKVLKRLGEVCAHVEHLHQGLGGEVNWHPVASLVQGNFH